MPTTDSLGVEIQAGDQVRVIYYGGRVRKDFVGMTFPVQALTGRGGVVAGQRSRPDVRAADFPTIPADYCAVLRREGEGLEGNR